MAKIAIIGAGNIGGVLAYLASVRELGEIVLVDIKEGLAKAKALDICQSSSVYGFKCRIFGTANFSAIRNSDVVIISAGVPRTPAIESREKLFEINKKIVEEVSQQIKEHAPNAFVIVITNPLDAMTYLALKTTCFPKHRIVGMGGILDTARLKAVIAKKIFVEYDDVNTIVIGGHDELMTPVLSQTTVKGKQLRFYMSEEEIKEAVQLTRNAGAEIVNLLGTSAYFGPASGAINIAESYLKNQKRVLPCSVLLEGEYGLKDICIGVPVKIGKEGIKEVVELNLTDEEKSNFLKSAEKIKDLICKI
jgi:malate dehydrogenase